MHELPVTQNILEIVLRHAGGHRVVGIYLVIGDLSSFVDESIQFYWGLIAEGTAAADARLHFRRIPAEMRCEECGAQYMIEHEQLLCPECGGARVRLVAGREFYVESIDVDELVLTEEDEL